DGDGRVLFSELLGARVRSIEPDGTLATVAARLFAPAGLAVSGRTLYIADNANHRVRIVNLETSVIATFAGTGDETFTGDRQEAGITALSRPAGVAASPTHLLSIADRDHHIVWRTAIRFLSLSVGR
ncbi:MAG: hypothetical protein ACREKI_05115, partial [Gemmatimonadota bacterium]